MSKGVIALQLSMNESSLLPPVWGHERNAHFFWTVVVLRVGDSKGFSLLRGHDDPKHAGRPPPSFLRGPSKDLLPLMQYLGSLLRKAIA